MILISYDISNDKLRTQLSRYLEKFGHRLQYSVFEIDNSDKILNNIMADISNNFEKRFSQEDSVMIFMLSNTCKIVKYGYARNEDDDLMVIM